VVTFSTSGTPSNPLAALVPNWNMGMTFFC